MDYIMADTKSKWPKYTFIKFYPQEPSQTETQFLKVLPQIQMENKKR